MATTCGPASLTAVPTTTLATSIVSRIPALALASSSCGLYNGAFRAVEMRGVVSMPMPLRKPLHVVAMAPPTTSGKVKKGSTRQSVVADVWSGRVGRGKSRRFAGPIKAMGEETMWITATSAVALVVALAAFAALGGYLLSMGVDNEELGEEEKIEKLKEQGLYEKSEPTQYEDQGVGTRTRKRRISEE